jgi:hypothetical protein
MTVDTKRDTCSLLRALLGGEFNLRDADTLVHVTVRQAEQVIFWISRRKNYRLHTTGLSLRDLAYDMTAELFAEGEDSPCASLRAMLLSQTDAPDDALLAAFDAIIVRTVHRQFPRIFAELNPDKQLLIKALRHHVRHRDEIMVMDMLDGRWYLFGDVSGALLHLPAMTFEELRFSIGKVDPLHRSPVVEIFRLIESALRRQDVYRRAVLEIDVLRLTVEFLGRSYEAVRPSSIPEDGPTHDEAVLSHVIHRAIERARSSLERSYIDRGSLSSRDFELMLAAIREALLDTRDHENGRSSYAQLRQYMPGLTPERYRESYRRKYAYMLEVVRREAQRLMQSEVVD